MDVRILLVLVVAGALAAQRSQQPQPRVVDPGGPGKAPSDAVALFDGTDVSHWTTRDGQPSKCGVEKDEMVCRTGAGDMYSKEKFRSAQIHLEFAIPLMPGHKGQLKGNSGIYLHGRYEIQVLDSFNNPTYPTGAAGALYGQSPPLVNPSRPPEEWQSYDIIFHAPQCDAEGKVTELATLTVLFNGVLVQDNVKIKASERGCREGGAGPLMLQDHSGFKDAPDTVMRFRNIWYRPLD